MFLESLQLFKRTDVDTIFFTILVSYQLLFQHVYCTTYEHCYFIPLQLKRSSKHYTNAESITNPFNEAGVVLN